MPISSKTPLSFSLLLLLSACAGNGPPPPPAQVSIDLLDNHTNGRFRETVQQVLDAKEYDRKGKGKLLYMPNKRGRSRLDALFGNPSPWEAPPRDPWIHVELYRMGERQEPGSIEEWAWPGHHAARTNRAGRSYRRRDLTEKGFEAELDRDYEKAIEYFEEALDSPIPEVPATPIMHAIARSHAALGHYEEAARIMERMVRVLEAEVAYSKGGVPSVEIGTEAYRGRRDTVYIY